MNEPIGITPAELWSVVLAVCGAIITISGAIAVIVNFVHKAKEPNKKQDERISTLEKNAKEINDRLERGDRHFISDAERMSALEREVKATNKVIIESLQALTSHAIDGNNVEQLKQSKKSLDDYLLDKI
jgi:phosphopantetheine adenylyltransferase